MRKIFFTALLAIGSFVAVNAQTANTVYNQNCCSRESEVNLDIDIRPILCLYPECDQNGYVDYNCREDFDAAKYFRQNNGIGSPDFQFSVWSNITHKVSTTADGANFNRTGGPVAGYNNFPVGNVLWNLKAAPITAIGAPLAAPGNYQLTDKTLSTTDASGDNTLNNVPWGVRSFTLNFRVKPGAALAHHPTSYAPGEYTMQVDITATAD
ncbi:hypothetical protein CAP36_14910 [Chitinophagaceae bacterium IBVUCB2]|nr:hypothetical protein CAP36_14910 [Chitinophagaceae bacterium IBVUCB2]